MTTFPRRQHARRNQSARTGKRRTFMAPGLRALALSLLVLGSVAAAVEVSSTQDASTSATILTDERGRALYVNLDEQGGTPLCTGDCTLNFTPVLAEGDTVVSGEVDASLLGTVTRDDGTVQLTYNGWPLYRFARDFNPVLRLGQGLNGVWYIVSVGGEPVGGPSTGGGADLSPEEVAALVSAGQQVFSTFCASCHGSNGQGGMGGPSLVNNANVARADHVLRQIVNGGNDMPAFGSFLSDDQVAAVATYVRRSWGNDLPALTPEEVKEHR